MNSDGIVYTGNFSIGKGSWGYSKGKVKNSNGLTSSFDTYIGDYLNSPSYKNLSMKYKIDEWALNLDQSKLKDETWCLGNYENAYDSSGNLLISETRHINDLMYDGTSYYYESGKRLAGRGVSAFATLKCDGNSFSSKVSTLTADEVAFAGGVVNTSNVNYYLYTSNYEWWSLTVYAYHVGGLDADYALLVDNDIGGFVVNYKDGSYYHKDIRPSIVLLADVSVTGGDGTIENPYTIK